MPRTRQSSPLQILNMHNFPLTYARYSKTFQECFAPPLARLHHNISTSNSVSQMHSVNAYVKSSPTFQAKLKQAANMLTFTPCNDTINGPAQCTHATYYGMYL